MTEVRGYDAVEGCLNYINAVTDKRGGGLQARCPAHDDSRASLSVSRAEDGTALVYCHAGCATKDVVEALGLKMSDLFMGDSQHGPSAAVYTYTDEEGNPLTRVHRTQPKGFWQERWEEDEWKPGLRTSRRVLYRLGDVLSGVRSGKPVYVTEGEKDADALRHRGYAATTALGGANKWRDEYTNSLAGGTVVVCSDSDEVGRKYSHRVKLELQRAGCTVRVVYPLVGKDVSDHLDAGYTVADLVEDDASLSILQPFDWTDYEVEETEWLLEPWVPRRSRVLAFGAAGSLKSLWALWLAARVAGEGGRVAYFSLEMTPSDLVRRLKQLKPSPNMEVYTSFSMNNYEQVAAVLDGMKGYDLLVVDSWSAAHSAGYGGQNEEVARLDREVFLPIVERTGATLLILDNTGHDVFTDSGKFKMQHARGASAKGDKMEVTLWFDRPYEDNNYVTRITVKKMRLDSRIPEPVVLGTPQDRIEFYRVSHNGSLADPVWPGDRVGLDQEPRSGAQEAPGAVFSDSGSSGTQDEGTSLQRRLKARLDDRLGRLKE